MANLIDFQRRFLHLNINTVIWKAPKGNMFLTIKIQKRNEVQ